MNEIEIKGDAVLLGGAWHYSDDEYNKGFVYQNERHVGILADDTLLTPDTARSMASALLHYADKADAWKAGE